MSQDIKRSPKSDNLINQENQKLIQDNKDLKRRLEERDKHIKYLNSQISQLQKLFTRYEHKIYQMLKEQIDQQDPSQANSITGKTKREIINLEYLRIQDELQMRNQGEGQLNLKPRINGNNPTLYLNKIQKHKSQLKYPQSDIVGHKQPDLSMELHEHSQYVPSSFLIKSQSTTANRQKYSNIFQLNQRQNQPMGQYDYQLYGEKKKFLQKQKQNIQCQKQYEKDYNYQQVENSNIFYNQEQQMEQQKTINQQKAQEHQTNTESKNNSNLIDYNQNQNQQQQFKKAQPQQIIIKNQILPSNNFPQINSKQQGQQLFQVQQQQQQLKKHEKNFQNSQVNQEFGQIYNYNTNNHTQQQKIQQQFIPYEEQNYYQQVEQGQRFKNINENSKNNLIQISSSNNQQDQQKYARQNQDQNSIPAHQSNSKIYNMHQQIQEMRQKKLDNFSRKNKNLQSNISEINIDNQNQIDYKQNDEVGIENSSSHLFSLGQENNNAFISKVPVNKLVRLDTREIDNRKHVVTEKILSSNQIDEL